MPDQVEKLALLSNYNSPYMTPNTIMKERQERQKAEFYLEHQKGLTNSNLRSYLIFYLSQVMANALLLALFAVRSYGDHCYGDQWECTSLRDNKSSSSNSSVPKTFIYIFGAGFGLNIMNFLI